MQAHGHKYSKEHFEDYRFRANIALYCKNGDWHTIDVYTTDENRERIWGVIDSSANKDKVEKLELKYLFSREQDEETSKFLLSW